MKRLLALMALLVASPVLADDWQRAFFDHSSTYHNHSEHVRRYRERHVPREVREWARRREPEVRSWVQRERIEVPQKHVPSSVCYNMTRTVGDQAVTVEGAKGEAIKAWSQMTRHDFGEKAMDFEVARDATFACVRSSIGSLAGAVFHRCEVIARPCTAPHMQRER